jgi:hypothetical protein
MTINTPAAPKSVAEALDQGIALANTNGAPPLPAADEDEDTAGGTTDDSTSTDSTDDSAAADDAAADNTGVDKSDAAGDRTGKEGDGADPADAAADTDDVEGDAATGADKATADAAAAAGTKDGKPPTAAVKKPDPLADPIPNALKRETKDRIRTLVDRTKTAETGLATVTGERDELIKAITDTGATPEQYAGVLDYLELVNSNDRNKQIAAANFMIRELSALSRIGGFRIPGVTTFSGHADLEKAVTDGKLTQELAEEIAASRAAATHQGKVGAAQQQASQARARYQQADQAARAEMNTLEAEFSKDPMYKAKKPIIVEMLNEMIRGDTKTGVPPLHPSKWPAAYKKLYETLPATLGGMKPVAKPGAGAAQPGGKVPANQPLRTQQPAGAQKQEPKSVAEALDMGIEMARGG